MNFSSLRKEVLKAFKSLHRARMTVFEGDDRALKFVRSQINETFKKNEHVTNESKIKNLIQFSRDVETELRTTVVQARAVEPGRYRVKFSDQTVMMDNTPYQEVPEDILLANSSKANRKCKK